MYCVNSEVAEEWGKVYERITDGVKKRKGEYYVDSQGSPLSPHFKVSLGFGDSTNPHSHHLLYNYDTYRDSDPDEADPEYDVVRKWMSEYLPWYRKVPSPLALFLFTPLYIAAQKNKYEPAVKRISKLVEKEYPSYYMKEFDNILGKMLNYVSARGGKLTNKDIRRFNKDAWELHKIFLTASYGAGCNTSSSISDLMNDVASEEGKLSKHIRKALLTGMLTFIVGFHVNHFIYRAPHHYEYKNENLKAEVHYYSPFPVGGLSSFISPIGGFSYLLKYDKVNEMLISIEKKENKKIGDLEIKKTTICECTYRLPEGSTILKALEKQKEIIEGCCNSCTGEEGNKNNKKLISLLIPKPPHIPTP